MPNPRLADAASPYLRQHADDPVDWYLWGEDAFARARELDRPIFLSVGYSACHWCHVMQRESFGDPDIAATLNDRFVPVKVDRELRPDVDALYMDYVVATAGRGGWPMSVFLSPSLAPLLGGTYFPKHASGSLPSFADVLEAIGSAYANDAEQMRLVIDSSLAFLREQAAPRREGELDPDAVDHAAEYLVRLTDPMFGGFGEGTKFPESPLILFLAAYHDLNPDPEIEFTIENSLTSMIRGGVYDQAGGGLHRYAVARDWRMPHFEKMLYDQALLLSTLAVAAPLASDDVVRAEYEHVARQTLAFLKREMAAPGGGFVAALAADTEGTEGGTYLWTRAQLLAVLSPEQYEVATALLGADAAEEPFTLVRANGRADRPQVVDGALAAILAERDRRPQPLADTKVVTSWNALVARGLMDAGRVFGDAAASTLGLNTLLAVLEEAATSSGLVHVPGDGSVSEVRLIEDAAHVAAACLSAHENTSDPAWLDRATRLHAEVLDSFADGDVLYMTPAGTELPVRPREQSDQPVPSGAATTIENAVRLAAATGDASYAEWARAALRQFWAISDFAPEHAGRALEAAVRLQRL